MRRAAVPLAAATLAFASAFAEGARAEDVLVVATRELEPALDTWRRHRGAQGLSVAVAPPGDDVGTTVRAAHAASSGKLRFVLLLGDVDRVPCAYVPVVATAKWEQDTRIATDAPYADVDGDGVPDLAIGRVPARSADDARALLARSVEHETRRAPGEWRRRLGVIAGVGGFGPLADTMLETMTRQLLTRAVPASVAVTATYGNPMSAWCPPPREFADVVLERFREGALAIVYMGHGHATELDRVKVGRDRFPILGPEQAARLDVEHGAPLTVFLACTTGKFDGAGDSLAETLLRRPRGPLAVIASSRVSTPYSNGILAKELMTALYAEPAPTAGEVLLEMKRRLVRARDDDAERRQIESLAHLFDPDPLRRDADRREHLALYNLLGDPCARIVRPAEMALDAPPKAPAGAAISVRGTAPESGSLVVEVLRRRDAPVPIGSRKSPEEWRATYREANSLLLGRTERDVPAGPFEVDVAVDPAAPPGPAVVRAWFEGRTVSAAGGRAVDVPAPPR